ncbi:MAG: hypothetical protein ACRDPF_26875, partial [Streptosporangiaceae bacterium]
MTALPACATALPRPYLAWYKAAARTCRGLSWQVLAGIGTMESDNGRSTARGVHKGKNREGAATGHLQRAVFAYNHACWYVRDVLAIAARYRAQGRSRRAFGPHRRHRVRRAGLCTGHRHPHGYGRKHGSRTAHRSHPGR